MALRRKKHEPAATQPVVAKEGRGLVMYFIPTLLVGAVVMVALALLALQKINSATAEATEERAATVAASVAQQIARDMQARRALMRLTLDDGNVAETLASRDATSIQSLASTLQRRLPGALQVRVLSRNTNEPDQGGVAPMGYAGLDMVRTTIQRQQPSTAEVHQIKTGAPYLAMALPISSGQETIGALFVAWDLRPLTATVASAPSVPGYLQLLQGGADGYVVAATDGARADVVGDDAVKVAETLWEIHFVAQPQVGGLGDLGLLLGVVGGGVILLLLVTLLQWRHLARDLRADMGAVVSLGEAILRRQSAPPPEPRVASSADAVALLCQYTRDAQSGQTPPGKAGKPPLVAKAADTPPVKLTDGLDVEELDHDPTELAGSGGKPPATPPQIEIPESLFRAYDIRGVFDDTLTPAIAALVGQALATLVQEKGGQQIVVGRDARTSSPALAEALISGLNAGGCDVLDIGQGPTPLLYFAMHTQPVQAGVMVTGSHNPASYNGFKIVVGDRVLDGDELLKLRERIQSGQFNQGNGTVQRVDLLDDYIEAVNNEVQLARPLKVIVDAGNGVAGEAAIAVLEALGCDVVPIFCEPDGDFPNHHPDPSQPDNLSSLILEVQAQEADLGVAFDGDGDRLGLVDNAGNIIWPDRLLMLLAADILERHPGVDILYDVKSSRHLASFILSRGGRPIMWQSGHSRMRAKMLETGALLGGEFSGHLFIKERWYGFDDAVYAAARVLEILALDPRSTDEVFAELPDSPSTREYHLSLEEGQSIELMQALDAYKVFEDARLIEIDGIRVEFSNGWGLIRPSNTTPALTFRFEADDANGLEQIKMRFRDLLRRVAPDLQPPF